MLALFPYFLCAFAPLRETFLSEISLKGAKAQRKTEYLFLSLALLAVHLFMNTGQTGVVNSPGNVGVAPRCDATNDAT